ncbi:MAG: hypothetical protein Q8R00_00140 [Candidatus Nanoarchaeia archaeon]|nr:hypothetical protein [Candidatus Nanoarchaeia archaeon]
MVDPIIKEIIGRLEVCYGLFDLDDYVGKLKVAIDYLLNYCDKEIKKENIVGFGKNERLIDSLNSLKIKLAQYLEYLKTQNESNQKIEKQEFLKVLINFRTVLTRGRYFEEFKLLQKIISS